jgi:hemolysin activation/secretion protein
MRLLYVVCLIGIAAPTFAAVPVLPGERELIRERQERLLDEQRQRIEELRQLPGEPESPPAAVDATEERCLPIQHIELHGAELIGVAEQSRLLSSFAGGCLGPSRLNELLKTVTNFYLDRGYVTSRAYLPQQDLAGGTLQVRVVEGYLEGFETAQGGPDERQVKMAFPGAAGERLDLRELEQMVDQLNRLPSQQARIELTPGEQVGGSRVQVLGERSKPWRVRLARHNDGERSTGEQQWGLGLDWDSPLGLGDQLILRAGRDAVSDSHRHSHNQSFNYSLPYGWWTFSYGYSQSYYRTLNQAAGFDFEVDGDSRNHYVRADRVLHRDTVSKTGMNLGVSHLRSRNYIEDSLIDVSSQRLSEFQLGFNHGRRIGSAFINGDIGWQHGTGAFDAQGSGDPRGAEPVARYNKYGLTLSYLQPFELWGEAFSVDSLLNLQRSEDVLYGPQRISIGGLHSVRGFKDQSLSGDSGGYWRNNLRWRRALNWAPLRAIVSEYGVALAYDIGQIKSDAHNPERRGRLSGNAIEFSAQGKYLAASLTFARSLQRPGVIERDERPVYVRIDLTF